MTNKDNSRMTRLSARTWAIINDAHRYRVLTPAVIQKRHMSSRTLNAVTKVTARMVRARLLCRYPLYHPRIYFTLGPVATQHLGVSTQRTLPLGPQALPTDFATMVYATRGTNERRRLTSDELVQLCSDMPVPLAEFPYCLDEKQAPPILELIRVDLGGKPDHVARKCDTDIELRKPVKQLMARLRAGSFRLVVITATSNKAAAIRNSLSQHIWPSGLTIHLAIVPELLHLTASTYYGA